MTNLFIDGGEGQEGVLLYDTWATSLQDYQTTTRFNRGWSIRHNNFVSDMRKKFAAAANLYHGFACRLASTGAGPNGYGFVAFAGDNDATQHIGISVSANWALEIRRGTTIVATSANNIIASNTWFYIEVRVVVSDTVGVVEVRLNGVTTPVLTFSGDTKNAGTNSTIDTIRWQLAANGISYMDDIYINDGTGTENNSFEGDCEVQTLVPTGAGASTGLTPSTGSNWQTVDEAPPVQTDYSGSSVSGTRDSYAITDLRAGTGVVKAVRQTTAWHKSDAGAASMKRVLRVGSTNYYGSNVALPSSMALSVDYIPKSPATSSAWTISEINGAEIGAEVV